jgi:predicted Fe-Mo cluster-binding NifX family protein
VLIAIPVLQERISPVLDTAARLLLITRRRGKELARREFVLGPLSSEGLARSVVELRVEVLLCAALSQGLHRELERRGVRVQAHLCGEAEAVLQAFCCDRLNQPVFRMPGCWKPHSPGGCCRRRNAARSGKSGGKEKQTGDLPKAPPQNHRGNP